MSFTRPLPVVPQGRSGIACLSAILIVATIAGKTPAAAQNAGHPIQGVVTNVLTKKQLVLIRHEAVPGVLAANVRAFRVSDEIFATLKSGTRIAGVLLPPQSDGWRIADLRLAAASGEIIAPDIPYRIALPAGTAGAHTFSGSIRLRSASAIACQVCVSSPAVRIEVPHLSETARAPPHDFAAAPHGFFPGPVFGLEPGRMDEIRFTHAPFAELDVLVRRIEN